MSPRPSSSPLTINATAELLEPHLEAGHGSNLAIVADEDSVTYRELDRLVNRFGNALKAMGVVKQDRIMFVLNDSIPLIAGYLAAMKIGAVALALNTRMSPEELQFILLDCGARVLFIEGEFVEAYKRISRDGENEVTVIARDERGVPDCVAIPEFLASASDELEPEPTSALDMAYWVYTSGTTGRPKAVVHRHRDVAIAHRHVGESFGVGPGECIYSTSKFFFAYTLGHSFFGGLKCGATILLRAGWPDARTVAEVIERSRPSVVFSVPTLYRNLILEGAASSDAFRAVRHYVSAGEPLSIQLFEQWLDATGVPIVEGIGASETTFLFIANTPKEYRPGATGRVLPWAEAKLLDDDGRFIRDPDTPGVLWVRMESLFEHYWNEPEKTDGSLVDGWYRTGDVFTFDGEGWWYYQGRDDDMLKVAGQWVRPTEIEDVALEMPEVREAAAVGARDPDGLVRTVLFVVPEGETPEPATFGDKILKFLGRRLPRFKCPREVRIVTEIPRTATGKAMRYQLRDLVESC